MSEALEKKTPGVVTILQWNAPMKRTHYTDDEIVRGLAGSPSERDAALKALFMNWQLKGYVTAFVRKNGGNQEDGEDIFQDAIILLDRRVREGGYKGQGSIDGYLQGIARRLWLRKRARWNNRTEELTPANQQEGVEEGPDLRMISQERLRAIDEILAQIGEKCKRVLTMYKLGRSMDEIAQAMSFASREVAKNEAYKCRKKFRGIVERNAEYLEILKLSL